MTRSALLRWGVIATALAGALSGAAQTPVNASEPALTPFSAYYEAQWKSITVGTSDLELKLGTEPNQYMYTWTIMARGIFKLIYSDAVVQKSWLSVHDAHIRPDKYHGEEGKSTISLDFDWKADRVHGTSEGKPVDLPLERGIQDVMSIQLEVMLDLKNGQLPKTFKIFEKDQLKEFEYTQEGSERIKTAIGELDTVIVANHRVGNNRILRMWFAPSLGFAPVQAERSRDGNLEFAMRIRTLKR